MENHIGLHTVKDKLRIRILAELQYFPMSSDSFYNSSVNTWSGVYASHCSQPEAAENYL